MPRRFLKVCNEPGCSAYTRSAGGYCDAHQKDNQLTRQQSDRGHAWYHLAIWRTTKRAFQMSQPERAWVCQHVDADGLMCGQPARICDHVTPFRGDWFLFLGGFNFENLQGMCQEHHNQKTVSEGQPVEENEYSDYE